MTMAVAASRLPRAPGHPAEAASGTRGLSSLAHGFSALARLRVIAIMTVVSLVFLLLSGMTEVIWPAYSKYSLHTSASGFGALMAATGLGATLGVLVFGGRLAGFRSRTALALVLCAQGLLFLPLTLVRSLPPALAFGFAVYFVGMPYYTLERTIVQRAVPEQVRGGIFGARRAITSGGYPLGAALAGPLVTAFGPAPLFGSVGIAMCVLGAGVWLAPALAQADAPADASRSSLHDHLPVTPE
jgi:MFS family permease